MSLRMLEFALKQRDQYRQLLTHILEAKNKALTDVVDESKKDSSPLVEGVEESAPNV
jgi:hypothetical protein